MKKTRHAEEQIAFALKQAETGTSVAEVIRRPGNRELNTLILGRHQSPDKRKPSGFLAPGSLCLRDPTSSSWRVPWAICQEGAAMGSCMLPGASTTTSAPMK